MRSYVGVVLVKEDGSVLAQHRDNIPTIIGPDTWSVVGGVSEETDTSLTAAGRRELLEETGYEIGDRHLNFLCRDTYVNERNETVTRTIFWSWYDGKQTIHCFEGQEIRFVKPTEFGDLTFYTGHEGFLRMASEKTLGQGVERK